MLMPSFFLTIVPKSCRAHLRMRTTGQDGQGRRFGVPIPKAEVRACVAIAEAAGRRGYSSQFGWYPKPWEAIPDLLSTTSQARGTTRGLAMVVGGGKDIAPGLKMWSRVRAGEV